MLKSVWNFLNGRIAYWFVCLFLAIQASAGLESSASTPMDVDQELTLANEFNKICSDKHADVEILLKAADRQSVHKQYNHAAAKYLSVAFIVSNRGRFRQGVPALVKAIEIGPKLSSDDKRDFSDALVVVDEQIRKVTTIEQEYIALNALKILDDSSAAVAEAREDWSVRLARCYIWEKRPRDAEKLLVELLDKLISNGSWNEQIKKSLLALIDAYKADEQNEMADQCYRRVVEIERGKDQTSYMQALEGYLSFLLQRTDAERVKSIADIYLPLARSSEPQRLSDQQLVRFAERLEVVDRPEANQFYELAFAVATNSPNPMHEDAHCRTSLKWSESLIKQGQIASAIEVLDKGLRYSKTMKPRIALRCERMLVPKCLALLALNGQMKELRELELQYQSDEDDLEKTSGQSNFDTTSNTTENQISRLVGESSKLLSQGQCKEALSTMTNAVAIYETLEPSLPGYKIDPYNRFRMVRLSFSQARCGYYDESTELLWRLVKKHLQLGFPDPALKTPRNLAGAGALAHEELIGTFRARDEIAYKQFLKLARASGKPVNVIAALQFSNPTNFGYSKDLAYFEEVEQLRVSGDPLLLVEAMLDTALALSYADRYAEARTKFNAATTIRATSAAAASADHTEIESRINSTQDQVAQSLLAHGDKAIAAKTYLEQLHRIVKGGSISERTGCEWRLEELALAMLADKNSRGGEQLLKQAISIATSADGDSSTVRSLKLRLAGFYVRINKPDKAASYFDQYFKSAELLASKSSIREALEMHATLLAKFGYIRESQRLTRLEQTFDLQGGEDIKEPTVAAIRELTNSGVKTTTTTAPNEILAKLDRQRKLYQP